MPRIIDNHVSPEFEWCMNLSNLHALASWLDGRSEFEKPGDVIYYYEKPWKWTDSWKEYQDWLMQDKMQGPV